MTEHVPYHDIPPEARALLDEIWLPRGAVIWWNARNATLDGLRPRDCPEEAIRLLESLAAGHFA